MVGSSFVFSGMSLLVRLAKDVPGLSVYHTTFFRFLVGVVFVGVYWLGRRERVRFVNRSWLVTRGVVGGVAVLLYFYGIVHVGLAKGTILNYTYPLWAAMMAPFILGERVSVGMWIAVLCALGGLYLLIVPSTGVGEVTYHDLLALSGGFLAGIAVLVIKRLRETDSSLSIFFSQSVFGLAMILYWTARTPMVFPAVGWVLCLGIGLVATVGQLMMTYAYKHVGGTEGSLLSLLTPVSNTILGVVLFREPLTFRAMVGGAIVLAACGYAAVPFRKESASPR